MNEELVVEKQKEIPLLESMKIECENCLEQCYEALSNKETVVVLQVKLAKAIRGLQQFDSKLRYWMKKDQA